MVTIILILIFALITLFLYACCVAAGKDSREIEREELRFFYEDLKKKN